MSTHLPDLESWRLADLFADDEAYAAARRELERELAGLERWRGRLGRSAAVLAEALEQITESYRRLARLRCYAALSSDLDTRVGRYQAMRQGLELLSTELATRVAYLRPEILEIDPGRIESFLADEARLAPHRFFLRDLIRQRAHVRGPAEERILSDSQLLTGTPAAVFRLLNDSELPRPEIVLGTGERVRLTPVEFQRHRASADRADRLRIFPAYFGAYAALRDTLGHNLFGTVKGHLFRSRNRGYGSCLEAALDADNVPVAVYRMLIRQLRERLPLIHRYYRLRARALGLERLEYPDLYPALGATPPGGYAPEAARRLLVDSLGPLGPRYTEALERAFVERWIDWHPRAGKRSGAYAAGGAYDVHPFVLLNYTGNFESLSTVAHEMGHAMHSHFSNATQPFATADYSIFVAEVASTVNEALLLRRMLHDAREDEERLFLLGSYLDGIRGTLVRQTMFAEFELAIHERAERGEGLTGEELCGLYLGLLRDYHGHDEGVMWIGDEYAIEWAAIPHFHYGFYVYQYATGIVAATALAVALLDEGEAAAARYLEFLSAGGSDYPLELLRRAGVDLEQAAPYEAAFAAVERRVDDLERLLDAEPSPRRPASPGGGACRS